MGSQSEAAIWRIRGGRRAFTEQRRRWPARLVTGSPRVSRRADFGVAIDLAQSAYKYADRPRRTLSDAERANWRQRSDRRACADIRRRHQA